MTRERFIRIASAASLGATAATLGFADAVRAVEGIVGKGKGAVVTIDDPSYPYPFFIAYDPKSGLTTMLFSTVFGFDNQGGIEIYDRLMDESADVLLPEKVSDNSVFPGIADISRYSGDDLPIFVWSTTMDEVLYALFTSPDDFPFYGLGLVALGFVKANIVTQLVKQPRGVATASGPVLRIDQQPAYLGRIIASIAGPLIADPAFGGLPNQLDPDHLKIKLI